MALSALSRLIGGKDFRSAPASAASDSPLAAASTADPSATWELGLSSGSGSRGDEEEGLPAVARRLQVWEA